MEHLTQDAWTTESPAEPGMYWFIRGNKDSSKADMQMVTVHRGDDGRLSYLGMEFYSQPHQRTGWWTPIIIPNPANIGFDHVHKPWREGADTPDLVIGAHEQVPEKQWEYSKSSYASAVVPCIREGNFPEEPLKRWFTSSFETRKKVY